MQTSLDPSTVELTRTRAALRPDIRFTPQHYGDELFYHLELSASSEFYRIGFTEYVFVSLLDGRTSFSAALAITAQTQGASAFSQHDAVTLYTWLLERRLITLVDDNGIPHKPKKAETNMASRLAKCNPFWIRIPLGCPDQLLRALQPALGWLFTLPATLAALLLMTAAAFQVSSDWTRFSSASEQVFAVDNWLWLLLAWMILKVMHETAHGLTCLRYGGEVRETGLILAFFAPLAYVDVSSSWAFRSRWQRIHTAAAGMYVELVVASCAVFGWTQTDSVTIAHLLYNLIVMASLSTILFNINPLMRFDGYYILSDLLQIPNLASKSAEVLRQTIGRILFGTKASTPTLKSHRIWTLRTYGAAALLWRLLICVSLLLAASVLFHGAGVLLAVLGAVAWYGMPIWNAIKALWRILEQSPMALIRAVTVVVPLAVVISACLFWLPAPFGATAPGMVTYPDGSFVRAGVDGFIDSVHVLPNQRVQQGQLLISLRNDDTALEQADLTLQLKQETLRYQRSVRDHEAGDARVAKSNLKSIQQRLDEASKRLKLLEIRANRSGVIVARDLSSLVGTYVQEGDELLVIDKGSREFRISISQEDVQQTSQLADAVVSLRIGTRPAIAGTIRRINPRASRDLLLPALAASEGGSVTVTAETTADGTETLKSTTERFDGVVTLGTDASILAGERGCVLLGIRDKPLGHHLYDYMESWLTAQVETATQAQRQ